MMFLWLSCDLFIFYLPIYLLDGECQGLEWSQSNNQFTHEASDLLQWV